MAGGRGAGVWAACPSPAPAAMYRALYGFRSAEPSSLAFAAGETFLLLERSNQHWWLVTRAGSGETGYVPASYLQRLQVRRGRRRARAGRRRRRQQWPGSAGAGSRPPPPPLARARGRGRESHRAFLLLGERLKVPEAPGGGEGRGRRGIMTEDRQVGRARVSFTPPAPRAHGWEAERPLCVGSAVTCGDDPCSFLHVCQEEALYKSCAQAPLCDYGRCWPHVMCYTALSGKGKYKVCWGAQSSISECPRCVPGMVCVPPGILTAQ